MTVTPPVKIVIDFLDGITQKKDAVAYARGFIESHFDVPSISGYYVIPFGNGYVYEAHEGGSQRAYLPRILKIIADNPAMTVSVRAGKRVLQISRGPRESFNAVLLPEELSSYLENVIDPEEEGPALTAYETPNLVWIIAGTIIATLCALVFIISLVFFVLDRAVDKPPEFALTQADHLPIRQWDMMTKSLQPNSYITALRYQDGNWRTDVKPISDFEKMAAGGAKPSLPAAGSPVATAPQKPPTHSTGVPPVPAPQFSPAPTVPQNSTATPANKPEDSGVVLIPESAPAPQAAPQQGVAAP